MVLLACLRNPAPNGPIVPAEMRLAEAYPTSIHSSDCGMREVMGNGRGNLTFNGWCHRRGGRGAFNDEKKPGRQDGMGLCLYQTKMVLCTGQWMALIIDPSSDQGDKHGEMTFHERLVDDLDDLRSKKIALEKLGQQIRQPWLCVPELSPSWWLLAELLTGKNSDFDRPSDLGSTQSGGKLYFSCV